MSGEIAVHDLPLQHPSVHLEQHQGIKRPLIMMDEVRFEDPR